MYIYIYIYIFIVTQIDVTVDMVFASAFHISIPRVSSVYITLLYRRLTYSDIIINVLSIHYRFYIPGRIHACPKFGNGTKLDVIHTFLHISIYIFLLVCGVTCVFGIGMQLLSACLYGIAMCIRACAYSFDSCWKIRCICVCACVL